MIDLKQYIKDVPDFPKDGVIFKDVTPLLQDKNAFSYAIDLLANEVCKYEKKNKIKFDKILSPEARGFIFGAPLAYKLSKGLVVARKPNKLPQPGVSISYDLEYGSTTLVLPKDSINEGEKILIVDDLLATGGSLNALVSLAKMAKGNPILSLFLIDLTFLHKELSIETCSIISY